MFRSLMASTQGAVDAVFCCNDDLALGALFESQRMNIKVPEELGLCGFNDFEASTFVNPSLTSVYTPRYDMGVQAATMIRSEEHTSELQSRGQLVCRLLLDKKRPS